MLDKPVSIKLVKHKEIYCRVGYRGGGANRSTKPGIKKYVDPCQ